jgi:hypothetical protein
MATSPADTSGTVGQTVVDVTSMIEHAVRRCGVLASVITAEQQKSARDNLFLILSNLATRGLSLWCVAKLTFGLTQGRIEYELPVGTVDVLKLFLKTGTQHEANAVGLGNATLTLTEALEINSLVVTPAVVGTYELVLEYFDSLNAVWIQTGSATVVYAEAVPIGLDAKVVASATTWRVRDARDPTRVFSAAYFLSTANDLEMSKLNRDAYTTLPDKTFSSQWPLQYWYDKQFYRPRISVWPLPTAQIPVRAYLQRQIQDPGLFTNAVEVPQRWLDAVISLLAPRVCLELPKELVPAGRLEVLERIAANALREAEDSETDGAPIMFAPNISPYTR